MTLLNEPHQPLIALRINDRLYIAYTRNAIMSADNLYINFKYENK